MHINSQPHDSSPPKTPINTMLRSLLTSTVTRLSPRWPVLIYAVTWATLLTLTVAVASFSPEVAFVSAISSTSKFSLVCGSEGSIRIPSDVPGDILCLPAHLFSKSAFDFIVPPVFAAVVVAASAYLIRAVGLWEADEVH